MQLLTQVGDNCLVYAAAMILDENPDTLIEEIGHDGQEIWWPERTGVTRKRGIHIQEIIDCVHARGKALMPIDLFPCCAPDIDAEPKEIWDRGHCMSRFKNMIAFRRGILIGLSESGAGHACAWDGQTVFDPRGFTCKLEDFTIRECWILLF